MTIKGNLELEHSTGTVMISTQDRNTINLNFSNRKVLWQFYKTYQQLKGTLPFFKEGKFIDDYEFELYLAERKLLKVGKGIMGKIFRIILL